VLHEFPVTRSKGQHTVLARLRRPISPREMLGKRRGQGMRGEDVKQATSRTRRRALRRATLSNPTILTISTSEPARRL
jgi:hypothetical protein